MGVSDDYFEEDDYVALEEDEGQVGRKQGAHEIDPITEKVQCTTIYKRGTRRRGNIPELSFENLSAYVLFKL